MGAKITRLGVNIDHVATLRQARGTPYPDPVDAAIIADQSGADFITLHLREDRRHIQDHDLFRLKKALPEKINFEMAVTEEMLSIASQVLPRDCCLVPEKREELTTEGGLDVVSQQESITAACKALLEQGIRVSLFVDADVKQVDAAQAAGAPVIEIHTGHYADSEGEQRQLELEKIRQAIEYAKSLGMQVNVGHGLNYDNVQAVAKIQGISDFNIGHAIVSEAVLSGMSAAVSRMKRCITDA